MNEIIEMQRALRYATDQHRAAGDRYGFHPYEYHLLAVSSVAWEFGVEDLVIHVAAFLHDTVEDTSTTPQDLADLFGEEVAELVWRVSNERVHPDGRKVKNRKEKALLTLPKIAACRRARVLKLCDRVANVRQCWEEQEAQGKGKLGMYKREYGAFRKALRPTVKPEDCEAALWDELDFLLTWRP